MADIEYMKSILEACRKSGPMDESFGSRYSGIEF